MKIALIDKDTRIRGVMKHIIHENTGHQVSTYDDVQSLLNSHNKKFDVIICDSNPTMQSLSSDINFIRDLHPSAKIVLVCPSEQNQKIADMLKEGVYDILQKGTEFKERLINILGNISELHALNSELKQLKSHISRKHEVSSTIVGESKVIRKIIELVEKAARSHNVPVSLHGESGTGKELIAKSIHYNSIREKHPFVTLNLGALPKELVESELFGHEPGSGPGAFSRTTGKLEQANNGTIFIKDIADLNLNLQFKLLQAIQNRTVKRTGSDKSIPADVRLITATSKDLSVEVKNGRFREDLYYRLVGFPIVLPALSERKNDIVLLADHFLNSFCQKNNLHEKKFSTAARNKLLNHNYPGNVRELNAIVELAAVLSSENIIEEEHIIFTPAQASLDIFSTEIPLREYEIKIIKHYLEKYNNNVVLVASKLQIGKSKIYNMIKTGEL